MLNFLKKLIRRVFQSEFRIIIKSKQIDQRSYEGKIIRVHTPQSTEFGIINSPQKPTTTSSKYYRTNTYDIPGTVCLKIQNNSVEINYATLTVVTADDNSVTLLFTY